MANEQNQYVRLPGKGSSSESVFALAGGKSRLYMGTDHLLRVNSTGWTESYRRFYFTDIQAVIVSLTKMRQFWTAICLAVCALFMLWFLAIENTPGRVILGCVAGFFLVVTLVNGVRGPTCRVRIRTRIGIEPLPSLQRLRNAQNAITLLKSHINAAQGELNPAEIPQKMADFAARPASFSQPAASFQRSSQAAANSYKGGLHSWLFVVFLVEAAMGAMQIFTPGLLAAILGASTVFVAGGLAVVAVVKQSRSALDEGVRIVTWAALVQVILCFVGGYLLMVNTIMEHPKVANDEAALFVAVSQLHPPWVDDIYGVLTIYAFIVAVAGLALLWSSRAAAASASETPSQL